jgi:hypothetical protein
VSGERTYSPEQQVALIKRGDTGVGADMVRAYMYRIEYLEGFADTGKMRLPTQEELEEDEQTRLGKEIEIVYPE